MKIFALILLGLLTVETSAQAGLGETYKECVNQYGPALRDDEGNLEKSSKLLPNSAQAEWEYEGYKIQIAWMAPEGAKGPADLVRITKTQGSLTPEEIQKLLYENSQKEVWIKAIEGTTQKYDPLGQVLSGTIPSKPFIMSWRQESGATATQVTANTLVLKSARLAKTEAEAKKAPQI